MMTGVNRILIKLRSFKFLDILSCYNSYAEQCTVKNRTVDGACHLCKVNLFSLKNTDAALLPTISYPAFAVDDDALYSQTLDKIVRKLRGKYGFKRFLRDGYRTTNEDKNRRYYKPAEMKVSAVCIVM